MSKKDVLNVNLNIEAIAASRRNADSLEGLALEIPTVNPMKITLKQDIYTLKAVPVNDRVKGKKKDFSPKVVGIKSITVSSLAIGVKENCITINGVIDVPETGNRVVKLEECLFDSEADARAVAKVITEVELEKAKEMADEANEAVNYLKEQLESDRF